MKLAHRIEGCAERAVSLLLLAGVVACGGFGTQRAAAADRTPLFSDDFEKDRGVWQPTDPAAWKRVSSAQGSYYSLCSQSKFEPPHRSPINFALLKAPSAGDFELELRARSTVKDYPHRDLCFVFGYQDPANFYYAHLGRSTDKNANQIFIVHNAPRVKISSRTSSGTLWDDAWHTIKIRRTLADGKISVFFDDLEHAVMEATDRTFGAGQIGIGSFDDTGDFDDVRLYALKQS